VCPCDILLSLDVCVDDSVDDVFCFVRACVRACVDMLISFSFLPPNAYIIHVRVQI